ncbi:MAG: hypothetical protein ACK5WI_13730, partial [Cyanobacteriota bacterium]
PRPAARPGHAVGPQAHAAAMEVCVAAGLAAAVIEASKSATCQWVALTGGDSAMLHDRVAPELRQLGLGVAHRPLLCLGSLARLRPAS